MMRSAIFVVFFALISTLSANASLIVDVPGTLGFCADWGCSGVSGSSGVVVSQNGDVNYYSLGAGTWIPLGPGPNGLLGWDNGTTHKLIDHNRSVYTDLYPNRSLVYALMPGIGQSYNLPVNFGGYAQTGTSIAGAQYSLDGLKSYAAICPQNGGVCEYLPQTSDTSVIYWVSDDLKLAVGEDGGGAYWQGGVGNWSRTSVPETVALISGSNQGYYTGISNTLAPLIGQFGGVPIPSCAFLGQGCTGTNRTIISQNGSLVGNQQSIGIFLGPAVQSSPIPEPSTYAMLTLGLAMMISGAKRKRDRD